MTNILNKYDEITNNKFVIAFLFFIFILPMGMIDKLYAALPMFKIRFLLGILVTLKFCINFKSNKKFPPMLLVGVIYCFGRILRTYIATGNIKTSLFDYSLLYMLILIMLVEGNIKNNGKNLIEGLLIYIETILLLNVIGIIFPSFGSLFTGSSILGTDNYHFVYYSLALIIPYIYYYIEKSKFSLINLIAVWTLTIAFQIKYWVATNLVAIAFFYISLLISKKFKIANIISYIIFYYVSFVGVILFNVQYLFSFLVVNVLHKSLTLSGRVGVWDKFKAEIVKSPIFGIGYQQDSLWFPSKGKSKGRYMYAHNHILQELFNGGIIMYLVCIWFVILPAKKLWENKDNKLAKVFSSIILAILVHCLSESLSMAVFVLIYTFAYHVNDFIKLGDTVNG